MILTQNKITAEELYNVLKDIKEILLVLTHKKYLILHIILVQELWVSQED